MPTNIVQSDQPSIYDTLSTLQTANPDQYAAIVRPDTPPSGIGGFVFVQNSPVCSNLAKS